jgi:molybdopterin biosynthesis enzyme MoaB
MAGVRGATLVINLPGSPKGAMESLEAVMPVLSHALDLVRGNTAHR